MMDITIETLKANYEQMDDAELIEISNANTLTPMAKSVMREILKERNIDISALNSTEGKSNSSEKFTTKSNLSDLEIGKDVECTHCGKKIPETDKYCSYCGKSTLKMSSEQQSAFNHGPKWILAISIMFLVFGTFLGFQAQSAAEKTKQELRFYQDDQILDNPVYGKKITVGELKALIDQEVIFVFALNYLLAAIMFGLFLWGLHAPFPAMVTALCVYLAVIVLNFIVEPTSLFQGILIKVLVIMALVAGIKASLVARQISLNTLSTK